MPDEIENGPEALEQDPANAIRGGGRTGRGER